MTRNSATSPRSPSTTTMTEETSTSTTTTPEQEEKEMMSSLLVESGNATTPTNNGSNNNNNTSTSSLTQNEWDAFFAKHFPSNPEFFQTACKFLMCFTGLQVSYLTWGFMQELIMKSEFNPTPSVPDGMFPSAAFCVFSNRFLAVIVAMIAVKIKHGSVFSNNKAPLIAFTPSAFSNTMSSWSQYASLKFVTFPVQTVFKSSKIIPVMMMGKMLKGTTYTYEQYFEAVLITSGVAIFSIYAKEHKDDDDDSSTGWKGLVLLLMYITFDSFTSQWQDRLYVSYGRPNIDPYQMMLGVNISAICFTTAGLIVSNDFPVVIEFFKYNPNVFHYNILTAITSASGQLCIFYTIKEFGPIVFTIIMTTRQMLSICLSAIVFRHHISFKALFGAIMVFGVIFYQIRRKYNARTSKMNNPSK